MHKKGYMIHHIAFFFLLRIDKEKTEENIYVCNKHKDISYEVHEAIFS